MASELLSTKQGEFNVSPVLPKGKQNIMIDIDGTVCEDVPNEEPDRMVTATPYKGAKEVINKWFEEGHVITFFTSRESLAHREITASWLKNHGFKYHKLLMDKPRGGSYHWIDNHMVQGSRFKTNWADLENEIEEKNKM